METRVAVCVKQYLRAICAAGGMTARSESARTAGARGGRSGKREKAWRREGIWRREAAGSNGPCGVIPSRGRVKTRFDS